MPTALGALLFFSASCSGPGSSPLDPEDDPSDSDRSAAPSNIGLVVGGSLNQSEQQIVSRLRDNFHRDVIVIDDGELASANLSDFALFVMSKTVLSTAVGTRLKTAEASVVFWEDNQQMLSMMATIDNTGASGTAWHAGADRIHVIAEAPMELRAGLSGEVRFYDRPDQVTYAPSGDLPASAIPIARFESGDNRFPIYAYEKGAPLADGTPAAGRRVYFGLYDDTFRFLTPDGLELFDATITWALGDDGLTRESMPAPTER